jgi:hypothetical protein
MKRFNAVCGWLAGLLFLAAAFSSRPGGSGSELCVRGLALVLVVWVAVNVLVGTVRIGRGVARGVSRLAEAGALSRPAQYGAGGQRLPADLIAQLCEQTGWVLVGREADKHRVRTNDGRPPAYIDVNCSAQKVNVVFQTWFQVQFSLEREPKGLFARVLMRNLELCWSHWALSLGGSCEACLTLSASVPTASLSAPLFVDICDEMTREMNAFRQELHDKFRYSLGDGGVDMADSPRAQGWDNRGGPLPHQLNGEEAQQWQIR